MWTKDISFWAIWSHNSSYQTQTLISGALCHGITPLINAIIAKRSSIVRLLVQNGANIDGQTDSGYTALMIAVLYQFDQIPNLIKLGASVNIRNNDGFSAFENALTRKMISAMKLIAFCTWSSNSEFFIFSF